jgi:hypothetical protein
MQSLGDGRVTGFVTVNFDNLVDGGTGRWAAAGRLGRNPDVVNVDGATGVATVCFGHPLMVEIVVGAVAADHRHQRLARRGHNVNLACAIFAIFFLDLGHFWFASLVTKSSRLAQPKNCRSALSAGTRSLRAAKKRKKN